MPLTASKSFWAVHVAQVLTIACSISTTVIYPAFAHRPIFVESGHSIQAAIDGAQQGAKIVVGPGNYAEQLTINKDGIWLVGQGAVLLPPTTPLTNECSGLAGPGTQTGICVVGTGVRLAPFVVEHRKVVSVDQAVTHVSVSGFQVRGFSGANIALVGAQDSQVTGNWLYDGGQYGALSDGSMDTIIADNAVIATGEILFIGICTDNVAGSEVSKNHVSGYYVGLCIQTPGADIHNNDVSNCCVGADVDPNVKGAKLQHNRFGPTNPACPLAGGAVGIYLSGSVDAEVRYNLIEGQHLEGMAAGLGVVDDFSTGSAIVASGNEVVFNTLKDNDLDIYFNTTGIGNMVANNDCTTPAALCS